MQERKHKPADPGSRQVVPEQRPAQGSDSTPLPAEFGGPEGPEPTRYGDWERRGRCSDF